MYMDRASEPPSSEEDNCMPLTLANTGEPLIIRRIGGSPEVRRHLETIGFTIGGSITVIATLGGNLIVNIKECRVAVSREMAQKILVA